MNEMDIVERLRDFKTEDVDLLFLKNDAASEIERLKKALNEILETGEHIVFPIADMTNIARSALQQKESE